MVCVVFDALLVSISINDLDISAVDCRDGSMSAMLYCNWLEMYHVTQYKHPIGQYVKSLTEFLLL